MALSNSPETFSVSPLPARITASVTGLSRKDHRTLLKKREWLQKYSVILPKSFERQGLPSPVSPTLVFAQEEAGTAVCVSPRGLLLTCAHCIAEAVEDVDWEKLHWLLFDSGEVVAAKLVVWDMQRDLALLAIVRASLVGGARPIFPFMHLSPAAPEVGSRLLCVGHPGSEDLEASMPGIQTNFDTLALSTGTFRGNAEGQNPQNNEEIGSLMHTCWTYWGHSGAPLVDAQSGTLVGIHSSWDEQTGMRRGIPWEALTEFLEAFKSS